MFDSGPRPADLPSRAELLEYSSPALLDLAIEYWFWGMRGDQQLHLVKLYIECNKGDKAACKVITDFKAAQDAKKAKETAPAAAE